MASSNRLRRIGKELADIQGDTASRIKAEPANGGSDLGHLHASFPGPPETPYEGGTYVVDVILPNEYPFKPPQMKFKTKLWHPNVSSQTGAICLDTLGTAWSPVLTIKSALLSLQSLLSTPEPKDPQDAEVASMLMKNPDQFQRVAREWAIKYANAPKSTQWETNIAHSPTNSRPKPQKNISREEQMRLEAARYQGYNKDLIDRFVNMGFDIDRVVEAFIFVNIDKNNGEDYELEEAYMGDITARLLGEP
ncbi:probable ubiquitin--protein ligase [Phialocephala subalpina]|uniref:Ubiquitin-conjugating enzyme E2 1 n=1 Tax=Phialocephala subalpina TaxID=576137 RepID=A0A1L7WPP4_9HELO|nr:probable ubiquitin--protein ligase [Phialocephala subalpina]